MIYARRKRRARTIWPIPAAILADPLMSSDRTSAGGAARAGKKNPGDYSTAAQVIGRSSQ